jgi:hypothetical protein
MAVPSEGEISLSGLSKEKSENNYNASVDIPGAISLQDLINGGKDFGSVISYDVTNTVSEYYPGDTGATVDRFSQWYSYDHDATPPEYIELINHGMLQFTDGTGTSSSKLSGSSDLLSGFGKVQHAYFRLQFLDNTFDQMIIDFAVEGLETVRVYIDPEGDPSNNPTTPIDWDLYKEITKGESRLLINGSSGTYVYVTMYNPGKTESTFQVSNIYCQPRQ